MEYKYISLNNLQTFLDLLKTNFGLKETTTKISTALEDNILNIDHTKLEFDTGSSNRIGYASLGEIILE